MRSPGLRGIALLACLSAACGGAANGDGIPRDRIESEVHTAFCEWNVRCEQIPDLATCLANTTLPIPPTLLAHVAAGRMVYEPVGGRELVAYWDELGCLRSENQSLATQRKLARARLAAFRGTAPVGGTCFFSEDCAEALCRRPACGQACCEGTCEARRPVASRGEECGVGVADCEDDSFCGNPDLTPQKQTCVARKALGATCNPGDAAFRNCEYGTSCQFVNATLYTCQEYPASDAPCAVDLCDDLRDSCSSGRCQRLLSIGGDCSVDPVACKASTFCDIETRKCRARVPNGAVCEPREGGDCLGDRYCDFDAKTCGASPVIPAPICT